MGKIDPSATFLEKSVSNRILVRQLTHIFSAIAVNSQEEVVRLITRQTKRNCRSKIKIFALLIFGFYKNIICTISETFNH
jgi:hypothetical protein